MPFVSHRRRPHLSSVQTNQVEVVGRICLCFPQDQGWFQGTIQSSEDDDMTYTLYGQRVIEDNTSNLPIEGSTKRSKCSSESSSNFSTSIPSISSSSSFSSTSSDVDDGIEADCKTSRKDSLEDDFQNMQVTNDSQDDLKNTSEEYRVTLTDHFTGLSYNLPRISLDLGGSGGNLFICDDKSTVVGMVVEATHRGQKADMVIQRGMGSSALSGRKCVVYEGHVNILFQEPVHTGSHWSL